MDVGSTLFAVQTGATDMGAAKQAQVAALEKQEMALQLQLQAIQRKGAADQAAAQKKADEDRIQQEGIAAKREYEARRAGYDNSFKADKEIRDANVEYDKMVAAGVAVPKSSIKKTWRRSRRNTGTRAKRLKTRHSARRIAEQEGLQHKEEAGLKASIEHLNRCATRT